MLWLLNHKLNPSVHETNGRNKKRICSNFKWKVIQKFLLFWKKVIVCMWAFTPNFDAKTVQAKIAKDLSCPHDNKLVEILSGSQAGLSALQTVKLNFQLVVHCHNWLNIKAMVANSEQWNGWQVRNRYQQTAIHVYV